NAANSALGRMIVRTAATRGLTSVAIVRQASQVDALKALGASAVVVSSADDFADQLADACRTHRAGIGFDAIAGTMTGAMLKALPGGACVLVYGALSLDPMQVDVGTLLFGNRVVEGFWLTEWIRRHGTKRVIRAMIEIQGALAHAMTTEVLATYTLDQAATGIRAYQDNMGAGKVVLRMV
ncbi:MAG: zinc-binding dehydrogenase, partial [Caldilinea sp.]